MILVLQLARPKRVTEVLWVHIWAYALATVWIVLLFFSWLVILRKESEFWNTHFLLFS